MRNDDPVSHLLSFWHVGARVARGSPDVDGTIVEATGLIKVKWDNGRTSYYRTGTPSAVRLRSFPQEKKILPE